jgi:Fe-S cluster assembly ATPase SufC
MGLGSAFDEERTTSNMGCDKHRKKVISIRRMEEALALLDEIDEGDLDPAALLQRAVARAKKELRESYGSAEDVIRINGSVMYQSNVLEPRPLRGHPAVVGRRRP